MRVGRRSRVRAWALGAAFTLTACGGTTTTEPPTTKPSASQAASESFAPTADPGTTPGPTSSPDATPAPPGSSLGEERINVLLIGIDRGPGRTNQHNSDVMMVASVDPVGKTASFLSIPRDLVDVRLADGTRYRGKINSLVRAADIAPGRFPDGDQGGEAVLAGALGRFLDLDIPYWASVDFTGFKALVKAVDGIDVYAWRPICDTTYRDDQFDGFGVDIGRWRMDANEALAWVRVRKPPPESDFTRTIRQVQALIALRARLVETGVFADPLPALRDLGVVRTNVPDALIEGLAALAPELTDERIYRRTIQPPELVDEASDGRGYILVAREADIAEVVGLLFTAPGKRPTTGAVKRYVSASPPTDLRGARCR